MVHVHGPSRRLRATFAKITQKQFKKKLCKCSKIRLLSLVNMTVVSPCATDRSNHTAEDKKYVSNFFKRKQKKISGSHF